METVSPINTPTTETITLKPSYTIPLVLTLLAIPFLWVQIWVALAIAVFGLFLMFQTIAIRLQFTSDALDVIRSNQLIRRFPYQEWQNWRIFWTGFPVLFYFKEINSIHFIPVLFDAKTLKSSLEQRIPLQ